MDLGILEERARERTCLECGEFFESDKESSALEKFSDHLGMHQPSAAQWSEAYTRMQRTKK